MSFCKLLLAIFILFFLTEFILSKHNKQTKHKRNHHKKHLHKKLRKNFFHSYKSFPDNEDVTSQIDAGREKISYFINENELPIYEKKFAEIRDLGAEVECKINGNCRGARREDIPDNFAQENEQQRFMDMAENQIHDHLPRFDSSSLSPDLNQQMMPDMTAVPNQDSPLGGQSNAAQFGQQPQPDIKMPSKDVVDMQQGQADNGRSEMMARMGSMPGNPGRMDTASLLREQSMRNDESIQNSIQSRINFMDQASNRGGNPSFRGGNPGFGMQGGADGPLGFMGQHSQESNINPHGIPNSDSSSVSDKDIMKAEGIAPNEMHDLHNFLKSSNEFHGENQGKFSSYDNPYGRSQPQRNMASNREEQRDDSFHDNPHHHHARKFMTNRKYNSEQEDRYAPQQENFERPNVNFFSRGKGDARLSSMKDRAFQKNAFKSHGGESMPSMSNLLEGMPPPPMGAVGGGPSNPDYVEQTARQLMQSNSDYKLPGTTFTNLWKSFMLTTQSQLGAADPSANSREGLMGEPKKESSQSRNWKKSFVLQKRHGQSQKKRSSFPRHH